MQSTQNTPVEEHESSTILRYYPVIKKEQTYHLRYNCFVFEKFNEMNTNAELQNDFTKWKNGINYKTNRKITINGNLHNKLREKFLIAYKCGGYPQILFSDLTTINPSEYLQKTIKWNNIVDYENALIQDYNKLIKSIRGKIEKIENWYDFVVFEGKKYGYPDKIRNNIHLENNCFGDMIFTREWTEHRDNLRAFRIDTSETTYSIKTCSKCQYEHKIEVRSQSTTGGYDPNESCGH